MINTAEQIWQRTGLFFYSETDARYKSPDVGVKEIHSNALWPALKHISFAAKFQPIH